jgi:hypothetical protein
MRPIGMLDSPCMRRAAISLEFLGVPFEHEAVSVFSPYLMFMPDKPAALREVRRVPRGGGLYLLSAWRRIEEIPHAMTGAQTGGDPCRGRAAGFIVQARAPG